MSAAEQLTFFPSLDFPGRTTLYMHEIAERLGCSVDQVYDLVEEGTLAAINIASEGAKRRELRVPIEAWRDFVLLRLTGEHRNAFLQALPKPVLRELQREIAEWLRTTP